MAVENLTGNESLEELQRLMEVFTNRIRLLDEKKNLTKPEIFEKVRGEYEAKQLELQVLLEEKGGGLQEALDSALSEQSDLINRETELKSEIEELDLRVAIGEVESSEYDNKTASYNQETENIGLKLQELATKIEKYQALVSGRSSASTMKPERAKVPPAKASVKPKPAFGNIAQTKAAQPSSATPSNEIDELEKQFANILGSSFAPKEAPAEPVFRKTPEAPIKENIPQESAESSMDAGENHEGELKCPKCGAFNRADNWYCEKCGNELINATDLLGGK